MYTAKQIVNGEEFFKAKATKAKPVYWDYDGPMTEEIAIIKFGYLARKFARQHKGCGADYDDLVQAGYEGIIHCLHKYQNCKQFTRYLQIRLLGLIIDTAEKMRKEAAYDKTVSFEELIDTPEENADFGWAKREDAMFRKLKELLSDDEIQIVTGLYERKSIRLIARERKVSHTAIEHRIKTIQKKLQPLVPWLEFMSELKCLQNEF